MAELLETEAIEEPAFETEASDEIPARPPPGAGRRQREVSIWRDEMRTAAIAAAGGLVAGAATVAVVRASRSVRLEAPQAGAPKLPRAPREGDRQPLVPGRRPPARQRPLAAAPWPPRSRSRSTPPWPYRLPRSSGGDGTLRSPRPGIACRLLHVDGEPVVVHAWEAGKGTGRVSRRRRGAQAAVSGRSSGCASRSASTRTSAAFYRRFRGDPLVGPADPSAPLASAAAPAVALGGAGLGGHRAADRGRAGGRDPAPDRRPLGAPAPDGGRRASRRPGRGADRRPGAGRAGGDGPRPVAGAGADPLRAGGRRRAGRSRARPRTTGACCGFPGIGPWTLQCLGLGGRGDPDSLPAGDLAYVKLVGRLAGLGRRATVPEIEEFFAPYAPYRGLAGSFALAHWHKTIAKGPPLRLAA